MFEIEYRGGNSIVVSTKKLNIVIDPKRSVFGMPDITEKDGVEIATEQRFATNSSVYRVLIEGPGEYEVSDVAIKGTPAYRHIDDPKSSTQDSTIYNIVISDIKIAVIGNIAPDLSDQQVDELGLTDILVLPVGGNGYTLDATSAAKIVRAVEPKIVIPVHHQDPLLSYEVSQDSIDTFINELKAPVKEDKKLKIKSDLNLPESLEVYKLSLVK